MNSFAIRALLPLTRMTWLEILALARAVYAGMNGNPAFPHPPVAIAVFRAAIDDFEASLVDAEDRGAKAMARRNALGQELMKMLRQFAHYVEHNCNNDMITFLSSGFKPVSKSQTAPWRRVCPSSPLPRLRSWSLGSPSLPVRPPGSLTLAC